MGILNPTEWVNGYADKEDVDPVASMILLVDDLDEIEKADRYSKRNGSRYNNRNTSHG